MAGLFLVISAGGNCRMRNVCVLCSLIVRTLQF